jgi:hypothetical protein
MERRKKDCRRSTCIGICRSTTGWQLASVLRSRRKCSRSESTFKHSKKKYLTYHIAHDLQKTVVVIRIYITLRHGNLAEWSKALESGSNLSSPKGRGFESHSCQVLLRLSV